MPARRAAVARIKLTGDLARKARDIERQITRAVGPNGVIQEANEQSLRWIQQQAAKNLNDSIQRNQRPGNFRTGRLEAAIHDPRYHEADHESISFMIDQRVRDDVPYYASLEYGDRSQIGRRIPFIFLGQRAGVFSPNVETDQGARYNRAQTNNPRRNNLRRNSVEQNGLPSDSRGIPARNVEGARLKTDRLVGPRERKGRSASRAFGSPTWFVTIRRPVPRYAYGQKAGRAFVQRREYETILMQAARKYGVELTIRR